MFGMGLPEILFILAIALIVFGPKKLPELAKSLGRAVGEFRSATRDLKDSFDIDSSVKKPSIDLDNIGVKPSTSHTPPETPNGEEPEPANAFDRNKAKPDEKTPEDYSI